MAPILLTVSEELELAPHMLKTNATETNPATDSQTHPQCQICFDNCVADPDDSAEPLTVSAFCGDACPAVVCHPCMAEHVRISVDAAFPGVLPKVRCPMCLVQVNKSAWEAFVTLEVRTQYEELCRKACSFRTPCCHNTLYTHLPIAVGASTRPLSYREPAKLTLEASLEAQLDTLHDQTRRFSQFEITAKDVILFLEETFGQHVDEATQLLILEHELPTILDEERRATLLLAYHAKYKVVTTRCCGTKTCFNCKRNMATHKGKECDRTKIDADCVIECRTCHVTMVKVEGCSAVQCWCGFSMDWSVELRIRDRNNKQLIPVDIFDLALYRTWEAWELTLRRTLTQSLVPQLRARRTRAINALLAASTGRRATLRAFVQRVKWRRRFKKVLPTLVHEIKARCTAGRLARLARSPVFVEAVRRAKWRARWKRVVTTIHAKFFWANYAREHADETRELEAVERELLLPNF